MSQAVRDLVIDQAAARAKSLTAEQILAGLEAAHVALGDAAYATAFDEGRQLPLDEAVAYAQRMRGERSRPTLGWASLTPTERRVVDLARRGRSNPQIAAELLMGTETVKTHLSSVYAKLGVANSTELTDELTES